MDLEEARKLVSNAVIADSLGIIVRVTGNWLIKNNLVEVYKKLRMTNQEIDEDFEDYLFLEQAEGIGIISKAY